jgi:oligopeptide transport system permease protein
MEFNEEINEILEKDFVFVDEANKKKDTINRPSVSYWKDSWRKLKKNKLAIVGLIFVILITLGAILIPWFSHHDYKTNNLMLTNQWPSAEHWFGTDSLGRDLFVRVMYGARYSLIIGFVASILNLFIVMMRIVDIISSIPMTIYVILLMVILEKGGLFNIIVALAISYWIGMARIVRAEILQLKQQEFILAAKTLGAQGKRILFKHLIPNCLGPIIVTLTLQIPTAIFTEAFLSFIGLGLVPPLASWGTLANDALSTLRLYPYQLLFPTLAICITIFSFNMLGDGLRDALDPRVKK